MSIDASLAKKSYPDRLDTNNKVELENGDYEAHVHDVWIYYVDIDGKFTKNRDDASGQKIKFTITLDGTHPPMALALELPVRIGKNTFYSKTIERMTGIADRKAHETFDPKTLVGKAFIVTLKCEEKIRKSPPHDPYPWTSVEGIRPRQTEIKRPTPVRGAAMPADNDDDYVPFPDDADFERR